MLGKKDEEGFQKDFFFLFELYLALAMIETEKPFC